MNPSLFNAITDSNERNGVRDFGEKIGGARKDLALSAPKDNTPKEKKPVDERPAWRRHWSAVPEMGRYDRYLKPEHQKTTGKFYVAYRGEPVRRPVFDTAELAEAFIPHAEVARNHRVAQVRGQNDTFVIYRKVGEHKRPIVRKGFTSEEEATRYMAEHPVEIIEHAFEFPDVPWLDSITREGPNERPGHISPEQFQSTFGFRGGEFGNWNMGTEGQAALNYAFDALNDLARVLQLPPRALSLDGKLAIAFGARGHGGKDAARAHYETDYVRDRLRRHQSDQDSRRRLPRSRMDARPRPLPE
jgi:hypothetical protein